MAFLNGSYILASYHHNLAMGWATHYKEILTAAFPKWKQEGNEASRKLNVYPELTTAIKEKYQSLLKDNNYDVPNLGPGLETVYMLPERYLFLYLTFWSCARK